MLDPIEFEKPVLSDQEQRDRLNKLEAHKVISALEEKPGTWAKIATFPIEAFGTKEFADFSEQCRILIDSPKYNAPSTELMHSEQIISSVSSPILLAGKTNGDVRTFYAFYKPMDPPKLPFWRMVLARITGCNYG
jgi:hypothetical protein